ncbi:MAG TPA: TetR/AcrR family transcriptional regulator [Gammaproteobacteria bacterium]|jgi:AcrR family transcriptional regulator|nr:TetR/AcrR family transcriptional regulator [Gammaproteobacteria bacterium]
MSSNPDIPLTAPGGGREAKREAILEAARKVFMDVGFGAASMDAIANEAKVSKQTVYNHFGSKEDLFAAMIRYWVDLKLVVFNEAAKSGKPEDTLRAMAHQFLDHGAAEQRVAMYRILMAEAPRFPELGDIFYSAGPAVVRKFAADYLAEQDARGTLKVENPKLAAEQFFGMLNGCQLKAQLGIEAIPTKQAIDAYIDHAVMLMMKALAPQKR